MVSNNFRRRAGQSTTEFLLMLVFLTAIGGLIMKTMTGGTGQSGGIAGMSKDAAQKISGDRE